MPPAPPPRASSGQGLRVLTFRRVPLYVSPLTLLFAVLIGSTYAQVDASRLPGLDQRQVWLLAGVTALALLVSLVLHEMGHALVAQRLGFEVLSITVFGFGGLTQFRPEPQTPRAEALVAAAGPAVNLLVGGIGWAAYQAVDGQTALGTLLLDVFTLNLALGVFNLAPGLPLDGGRVLLAGLWRLTHDQLRATRAAAYAGFVVALAVVLLGTRFGGASGSIWLFAIAAVIAVGAWQTLKRAQVRGRLPGLSAGGLARRALPVEASLPLAEAMRRATESHSGAVVVVDGRGEPAALMNGAAADAVPTDRRPWTSVSDVARSIQPGLVLDADLAGEQLLAALERTPASEYLVMQQGQPVGVLAAVDLAARLSQPSRGPT